IEPKDAPLIGSPQKSPANVEYEAEVAKLQGEVTTYREERYAKILASLQQPKVIADYLMAAQEAKSLKGDESMRAFAQKKDLNALPNGGGQSDPQKTQDPPFPEGGGKLVRGAGGKVAAELAKSELLKAAESPTTVALAEVEKLYNRADRDKQRQLEN